MKISRLLGGNEMALRLTSIILHGLLAVLALVIGLTALYYPSNIYVTPVPSVWITLLVLYLIIIIASTFIQLQRPSGGLLVLSVLVLTLGFFSIPVVAAFVEFTFHL